MELEARLRAFAAVAREGSFSRAAETLYVSQPAVSKHVAALEVEVGEQLLVRGHGGVALTPAGQVLADYVLRAQALLANARRALGEGEHAQIGTLALAASGVPGTYLLPATLARFRELHPAVEIEFHVTTSTGALERVRAHESELAVVGGFTTPRELEAEPLAEDEIVLVGPPSLGARRFRPTDLEQLTWVTREEGSATRAAVEAARWELGLGSVRTLELPSWEAVKLAVAAGAGIAPISRVALDLELAAGALVVLDVPRWQLRRTISVVRARDVPLTPPAERFLGLLRDAFASDVEALPPNSNLPAEPTPLVGRERDLSELVRLVGTSRLVTLTGPGGSGKTRLAVAAAAGLVDEFADGVFLVELAPLRDADLVERAIADTVGAGEEPLTDRRTLLVLDNLEHLHGAGRVVSRLLARTEHIRVLATSRTPLRVRAEVRFPVGPLGDHDAVQLFVERALAADPRFEADAAVPAICERVDRLPLGLELAAARVATFTTTALLERLERPLPVLVGGARDLPERQRTLRRTVEWSRELLSREDADCFERLAIFRGGWTPDAAAALGIGERALADLVESSLVQRIDERYAMLETIRELAHERFEARADAERLRRRHAQHVRAFAEEALTHARGPDEALWLARTAVELDNIRAALDWCLERGEAALGLAIAGALEPFWYRGARFREGRTRLEPLLELKGRTPAGVRARALAAAGRLASELGDAAAARKRFDEALPLARRARDRECEAWVLHGLGVVAALEGERNRAKRFLEESFERFLELEQHAPAGGRLSYLAELAHEDGDLAAMQSYYERSIEQYRQAGDESGAAGSIEGLAFVAFEEGDLGRAGELFTRALDGSDDLGLAYALAGIAAVAARNGNRAGAARLLGAVERLESELDAGPIAGMRPGYAEAVGKADADGRRLSRDEAVALARELLERGQ